VNNIFIRQLNTADSDELFWLIDSNRDYLGNWLPWIAHTISKSDTEAFIHKSLDLYQERKGYFCGIFIQNRIVGVIGATEYSDTSNAMYLNYWVSAAWSNRGIATQAGRQLIRFLESEWGIDIFFITLSDKNIASLRVAEKLGFQFSNTLPDSNQNTDSLIANHLYKRLKENPDDLFSEI